MSKIVKCVAFCFSALTLLVGQQDGYASCIKVDVSLLVVDKLTGAFDILFLLQ